MNFKARGSRHDTHELVCSSRSATVLRGILAGTVIDRVIVGGPAWHKLGAAAWVQYSRRADLGTGLVAYSVGGIGTMLLMIAATVSNYLDRYGSRGVVIPLYFAVAFSVMGLRLTVKAAPIMLGLRSPQPTTALQRAFDEFFFWGLYLRGSADRLAFLAEVLARAGLCRIGGLATGQPTGGA